jgi:predicted nucleic-acid-binding Zn-ribbon protein
MAIDLEKIKKNYESFDDFKLEHLAKNEVGSLEPEVIEILTAEIKKRGLDSNLEKGIEAQTKELTESELNELKNKITHLTCPECGQKNGQLVGSIIRTVKSFILLTSYKKVPVITCKSCADKKKKNAMISTALLGWWGIPFGLFRTPIALIATLTDKNKSEEISDDIITGFSIENIGEIRTNWDKEDELVEFIGHVNNQN